ncbi:HTH-type transcriptional regulator DegA [bacterium HR16]|nr:HTH-type transcriptional regulator DegA [bacterium HR16]
MRVTAKQIAKQLGISPSTVSRVLNGRGGGFISEVTRQRVLDAAREMGYRPHHAARALVTGRTQTIALWMYSLRTSFHAYIAHLMQQILYQNNYLCLIFPEDYLNASTYPADGQVDGIIAHECVDRVRAFLQIPSSTPLVSVGCYYITECDHVGIDLFAGTAEALYYLLDTGRRRIAYLVNTSSYHAGEPRGDAYRLVMEQAGLPVEVIFTADQSRWRTYDGVKQYLQHHKAPDAIFCHNDHMAMACYKCLRDIGLRVPDDVALVGCDGIEETEFWETPLSTIVQPLEEMCQIAWSFLQKRLQQPDLPIQQAILKPRLVVRASSQP